MQASCLAAPFGARLAQPGSRDDRGAVHLAANDFELPPLRHGRLMDVARNDQLRARIDEAAEDRASVRDRPLRGAPGRSEQMMVQGDDLEGVGGSLGEAAADLLDL